MTRPESIDFTGPELCSLSATSIVDSLRRGELSPLEVLESSIARIESTNSTINSIVTSCFDRARESINSLSIDVSTNILFGLPVPIKDLSSVSGVRTTMGTQGLSDYIPTENDPIVDILESHGGIIHAKTNTPEMGAGANTYNSVFGRTCNPWNVSCNAGGSSGGAAAALSSGQVWLAHGSDLAGSLRTPAAYCGVVGFRPTPGVAFGGPLDLGFSNEGVHGPMARDIADCALLLDAMSGYDSRSPLSLPSPAVPYRESVSRVDSIKGIKIAYSPTLDNFAPVESEIINIMTAALSCASGDGAIVEESCPSLSHLYETYITLRALFWASTAGRLPDSIQRHFKDTLRDNIALGKNLDVDTIIAANIHRTSLYHSLRVFLCEYDVLACAVVGLEPQALEIEYPASVAGVEMSGYIDWLRFSFLSPTTGLPSLSLPVGFTSSGLPVGIQLIGPPRGDAKLLCVARALELSLNLDSGPIDPIIS